MYRVLHIMAGADAGGISTVVLNYYRFIDRSKIQFDIALTGEQDGLNGQRLRALGAEFYRLPPKSKGLKPFRKALEEIFQKRHYDAVHVHENETSYVALWIAKKYGIPARFAHAHTSSPYSSIKSELRRLSGCVLNAHYATCIIGCGRLAGERVFGKWNMRRHKAVILPNAIDTEVFAFNELVRRSVRNELRLENRFVIGMVGRLSPEKNHAYALHVVEKLHQIIPNIAFLVVGNGDEEAKLKGTVVSKNMGAYVHFLGRRSDVNKFYQSFDVLIMPSIHEGFPVAAVEAMASGLPVLLSDTITKELEFGSAVRYIRLGEDEQWLNALAGFADEGIRADRIYEVRANGLDIRDAAKKLERIYLAEIR